MKTRNFASRIIVFNYNLLELKWKDEKDKGRECRLTEVMNNDKLDKYLCNKIQ